MRKLQWIASTRLQWSLIVVISVFLFVACVILFARDDEPVPTLATVQARESVEPPILAPLTPDEDRLWQRLRPRVEQRMVEAFEEASSDKKTGIGTLLAAAVGRLVLRLVEGAVATMILAAVVALFWKYWWVVTGFFGVVAAVGYAGGRKAVK